MLMMKGKNLSIAISISGLEALPAEPVDLLVALGGRVANLVWDFYFTGETSCTNLSG